MTSEHFAIWNGVTQVFCRDKECRRIIKPGTWAYTDHTGVYHEICAPDYQNQEVHNDET